MKIIKAQAEHAEVLATLMEPIQKIHAEHYPDLFNFPLDRERTIGFFRKQIDKKNSIIFIAEINGAAVGYIWCTRETRTESIFKHRHTKIYIHHISVNPDCQGQGAGRRLMQAAEKLAEANGVTKIELDSWGFNSEAHRFFEKLGYSRFNVSMWKTLEL